METEIETKRIKALAAFLECDETNAENLIESGDYLVYTDDEANEAATESIKDSLWAFNAEFILSECELDLSGAESLRTMQQNSCEAANDFILSLIEKTCGLTEFVESAISTDGRGHFLSVYDGHENEQSVIDDDKADETEFFIYRCN